MSEKIVIGIADGLTGENVTQELTGAELTDFNTDRAKFDSIVQNQEIEAQTKRKAIKLKLNALGLSDEDLIVLGLIPKAAPSTPIVTDAD